MDMCHLRRFVTVVVFMIGVAVTAASATSHKHPKHLRKTAGAKATPRAKPAEAGSAALTNAEIARMVAWGIPAKDIVTTIQTHRTDFTMSNASMKSLEGMDPSIIAAMAASIQHGGSAIANAEATTPAPAALPAATQKPAPPASAGSTLSDNVREDLRNLSFPKLHSSSGQPESGQSPPSRLARSRLALEAPQQCSAAEKRCIQFDWGLKQASASQVTSTGRYKFIVVHLNDILYDYSFQVQTPSVSSDDAGALSEAVGAAAAHKLVGPPPPPPPPPPRYFTGQSLPTCTLDALEATYRKDFGVLNDAMAGFDPAPANGAKPDSIPLETTEEAWKGVSDDYNKAMQDAANLQVALLRVCKSDSGAPAAANLLLDGTLKKVIGEVQAIQTRVDLPHSREIDYYCDRTVGCNVLITESKAGTATSASPNPWETDLASTTSQMTLSAGFLMTEIQARSYSVAAAPIGSGSSLTTQNVLDVNGARSRLRPALTLLLNYHLPWLDSSRFGPALSAGPVFEVANGKADTSSFGVFAGASIHLWNRLYLTAGEHFGQFSDFPLGYTAVGQPVPANAGTPSGVSRWTGRFAIGITFKGKDLPIGSDSPKSPAPSGSTASSKQGNS